MVPDPWLTIGEHSRANLFQDRPGLRIVFIKPIEEFIIDGYGNVGCPVLGGVSLTGDEIVDVWIIPGKDAHSSRAPDPTRDDALSDRVIDFHRVQGCERSTLPMATV